MGKKSKISYKILQNPKKEGGLNLVNLNLKDKALKATWPQILYQEPEYASLVYVTLKVPDLKDNIWRCTISPEDAGNFKTTNTFWKDVLKAWSEYNYYHDKREEKQIIWYNSEIKIGKKMIMWRDAYKKGLVYVHQLFEHQQFKSSNQVLQEYVLSQMRYNGLKQAIPKWVEKVL